MILTTFMMCPFCIPAELPALSLTPVFSPARSASRSGNAIASLVGCGPSGWGENASEMRHRSHRSHSTRCTCHEKNRLCNRTPSIGRPVKASRSPNPHISVERKSGVSQTVQ
ncbi:hypothetical protein KCP71_21070 [Salmonella enterica subsp. enterica]|nr:hypothetical protein KCP71_21070 [Salmonella enterica subsp. enterica]